MLGGTISMLFAFWVFDTAALISWMPFSCASPPRHATEALTHRIL